MSRYDPNTLARSCRVSPGHLRRFFSLRFGMPPQEWLNEIRLWDAARLLCRDALLKEIVFELRFGNIAHLCHSFKKYHGCTPSQFVKLYTDRKAQLRTV